MQQCKTEVSGVVQLLPKTITVFSPALGQRQRKGKFYKLDVR